MTDTTPQGGEAIAQPVIKLLAHYIRDLSFENVGAVEGTQAEGRPEINVNVGMEATGLGEDRYQINMKINATATAGGTTRFITELDYAGVFSITQVAQEHLHPFLFIECPRQLLPFARRVVADVTRDGGYPPLMLDNVDFSQLYRAKIDEIRRQQAADGNGAGGAQLA